MIHPISVFLRLLCILPLGYSTRVDFKRVPTLHGGERLPGSFFFDDSGVAERTAREGRSVGLKNVNDVLYVANVTVGGQDYVLQGSIYASRVSADGRLIPTKLDSGPAAPCTSPPAPLFPQ